MRVLLVEGEEGAARMLAKGLREESYAVDVARDGRAALGQAQLNDYDLIILDVMLPGKDGLEVCRELRAGGSRVPILMLTARDAVEDRIGGLLARARALLRRAPALLPEVITVADLAINTRARRVSRAGRAVDLTAKEYALLEYLARRAADSPPSAFTFRLPSIC